MAVDRMELSRRIAAATNMSELQARDFLSAFQAEVTDALVRGEWVILGGFLRMGTKVVNERSQIHYHGGQIKNFEKKHREVFCNPGKDIKLAVKEIEEDGYEDGGYLPIVQDARGRNKR